MTWERFTAVGRSFKTFLSIWKGGTLSLNAGAAELFGVDDYEFAVLYFNRKDNAIGIRLTNDGDEDGAVKLHHGSTGATIRARSFIDFYGLQDCVSGKYPLRRDEQEQLLIATLKKGEQG